jgi:signal transduction histidine kinase
MLGVNPSSPLKASWRTLVLVFVAYLVTARVAIGLPVGEGIIAAVWVPGGIALAAFVLLGSRVAPAVFAASLIANATSDTPVLLAAALALGSTLEPLVGAAVLRRLGFRIAIDRMKDVGVLVVATLASCVIAATNGVWWLWLDGAIDGGDLASQWVLWWFGDAMGMLVAAPVLLVAASLLQQGGRPTRARGAELLVALVLLAGTCVLVFADDGWRRPALLIPMWAWATLRFRALGASTATLVVGVVGVASVLRGTVVLEGATLTQTVQMLQGLLAIVGLSLLAIAAALSERDATHRELELALGDEQETSRRLREIDEAKDHLLAAVSHELRTPLTSILALSTLLQDGHRSYAPDKLDEMHARLTMEAQRLDSMLSDLLDLERLRLGMLQPRYERVSVPAIVQQVIERYAAIERPATMNLESVQIDADAAKLERIIDNLVGNAYKHTPRNRRVSVSVRALGGGAMIAVDDEGAGIHDRDKQSIFEPFNRGSGDPNLAPGAGIGLSLVARFTELHGGRSWVEDRATGGSSFRVFLPGEHDTARK